MSGGGFGPVQPRPTTQAEVLLAIVEKIRLNVEAFENEKVCFITASQGLPSVELQDNLFCTVYPGEGSYDLSLIDGGGNAQVCETITVGVSIWSQIMVDEIERFEAGFTDVERGLFVLKGQLLAALAGKNLDSGDGSVLLIESLNPSRSRTEAEQHQDEESGQFAGLTITFDAKFRWDLGAPDPNLS